METVKVIKTTEPKAKPTGPLGFGKYFTDHMFIMEYEDGEWKNARIQPYQNLSLAPSASVCITHRAYSKALKLIKTLRAR